ncbi:non-canonical purine NTP diphosphatase [soil metagenome]
MTQLIFATANQNKADEINAALNGEFEIITLKQAGINIDIAEPFATLEENASEKANVIYRITNKVCFSEDTGLETEALNGEPGVKSARYAVEEKSFEKNIDLLLTKLAGNTNRNAQFRTIICLISAGKEYKFEGICKGSIIAERKGTGGFGYDAVFVPEGSSKTFAEMTIVEKNQFSHRKKAVEKLISFLTNSTKNKINNK